MWNSAGSGLVVRSRLNRVTTVWKPCASITVHCFSAKVEASKTSERCAVPPERRPVLDLDRDRFALLGDAQDLCVAGHVDVVGKEKLERRLADEILVLRVELFVDDGDAAAVGDDLEARRVGIFEPHAAGAGHAQRSLRAPSVRSDLNEIGGHDAGRVEPGVGARDRFVRRESAQGRRSSTIWRTFAPPRLARSDQAALAAPRRQRRPLRRPAEARAVGSVSPRNQVLSTVD